jgi:class 3 adenylate cyclase
MGSATVGTLGWHGRLDYTAIGNVVNLASRLCDLAEDAQILVDPVVTGHVKESIALASIGERAIKGYDRALEVFAVVRSVASPAHLVPHGRPPLDSVTVRRAVDISLGRVPVI